jgi:hypothetical protein
MTTFRTVLEATGGNNVGIVVPDDVVLSFNRGKRVPVVVTIDGDYTYKTTIGVMGGGTSSRSTPRPAGTPAMVPVTRSRSTSSSTPTAEQNPPPTRGRHLAARPNQPTGGGWRVAGRPRLTSSRKGSLVGRRRLRLEDARRRCGRPATGSPYGTTSSGFCVRCACEAGAVRFDGSHLVPGPTSLYGFSARGDPGIEEPVARRLGRSACVAAPAVRKEGTFDLASDLRRRAE